MKTIFVNALWVMALTLLFQTATAQTSSLDLTASLAIDPGVKIGKLENGLVYYIRQNKKPEKRVELRLVVNAGSILENDDQQGLAHFMEHMNFNGTKSFPKNELIDFLQKTGVRFGADINAYTSFDETVYMLQLPTDDTALVSKGFLVLEEWAHEATLEGKEIDKERGVIIEEWRLGLGAQDRMMKKFLPVIFKDSRYATRIPIGKIEVLEKFKHETLRDFYRDWYRPDLQAIVVVGDIDPAEVEARIKTRFSALKNPEIVRERVMYDLPDNKDPLIAITTDKEATQNMILMFYKHPKKDEKNLGDFMERIRGELYTGMLNQRLGELAQKPQCPFIYAGSNYGKFLARTRDSYVLSAMSKENQIAASLNVMLAENERVRQFGFTATEFERQKEELFSQYETAAKEFDKTESARIAGKYVDNYLSGSPIPGPQKEFKYLKNILPEIKLDDINALAKQWVTDNNMAMVIMAPEKEGVIVPTVDEVLQVVSNSKTTELKPYVDNYRPEPLIPYALPGSMITDRQENSDLGTTELTLANGVVVVLKPTTFKNDEILISAYSPGGNSLYPDKDFVSANFAAQIIDMSGAGAFDNISLEKNLKGKNLQISPYIDDVKEGFRGNTSPKDLEALMELVYLYFKAPRKDTTAFQAFISQMENQMKFMKSNPVMTFYDTLFKTAYPGNKRLIILPSPEQIKAVNLDDAYRIYTDRFADASDFKFFIVGNFTIDSIMPLIQKYLGSLPSTGRKESWKDTSPQFAKGAINLTFNKGTDPQSMVGIALSEPLEWNQKSLLELNMLKEILSIKLIEVIREKLSGVYSPQIMMQYEQYPKPMFMAGILFGCSPKMTDKLTKAVFGEIKKLRKNGPTETDLSKARETLLRGRETDLEKNSFWLSKIEGVYYDKSDPASVKTFNERVNAVTVADLKSAAEKMLVPDHYVRVVLMPEKK